MAPGLETSRRALLRAAASAPLTGVGDVAAAEPDPAQALLTEQIEAGHQSVGYVAALVDDAGRRRTPVAGGSGGARALDGDTLFEIGSVTKVFTALLLAEMAGRGEVAMDDPVAKLLPPEGRPKPFDGKPMSLLDLATHTSGLPRLPDNLRPADPANPYADYGQARLYEFLSAFEPKHFPGSRYEYSNLGFGLLGHALSLRAGRGYEDLLVERVCAPLGLDVTRVTLPPELRGRLAQGHDAALRPVPAWDFDVLAGAGALRSSANDLARFLDAAQGRTGKPLASAFARLLDVRRPTGLPDAFAAAGWLVQNGRRGEIVVKTGGTFGCSCSVGYSARTGAAAVLLSDAASHDATQALGLHLIDADFPAPSIRREASVDPARLAGYVGRYALSPGFVIAVALKDGVLTGQATGQDAFEMFAESDTRFFLRAVKAEVTFEPGPDGRATALVLHQNGRDMRGERMP